MRNCTLPRAIVVGVIVCGISQQSFADLVQYWPFDDGATNPTSATAANLVAGGNVGQLSAGGVATSWTTSGLHGPLASRTTDPSTGAVRLNGDDDDIVNGGDIALETTASAGTASVSMWIYPVTITHDSRLLNQVGHIDCCSSGEGGSLRIGSLSGRVDVWPNDGTDWSTIAAGDSPANSVVADEWQHLAFVWNLDQVTLYLDGVATGTVTSNFTYDNATAPAGNNYDFGLAAKLNSNFGDTFDGFVDDLSVWDSALTAPQIAALASGASPLSVAVPEPSSLLLLACGLIGFLGLLRTTDPASPLA